MADWLDEIQAQIDDTVPYYVPALIAGCRHGRAYQRLAEAARAWNRARLLALAIRDARGACQCEQETPGGDETDGYAPGVPPCWKGAEWDTDYNPTRPSEWCPGCLRRQKIHIALCAVMKMRGARMRSLQRLAASTGGPAEAAGR
jgi:hypothetical protein